MEGFLAKDMEIRLLDLDQPREGFRRFIAAWLVRGNGLCFLVDPGPRSSAAALVAGLKNLGVQRLDWVLLTHIHLDHAGGAYKLLESFPEARIFAHPRAVPHLLDPARLWEGSLRALGELASLYGRPEPLSPDRMVPEEELQEAGIRVIQTPGHAVHHVSLMVGEVLFAGEVLGVRLSLEGRRDYLRPATPSPFFLEPQLSSLERLMDLEPRPRWTVFGHYGFRERYMELVREAQGQLKRWVNVARRFLGGPEEEAVRTIRGLLMREDPLFGQGAFEALPSDIRTREAFFVENSLKGILGCLKRSASA